MAGQNSPRLQAVIQMARKASKFKTIGVFRSDAAGAIPFVLAGADL